MTLQQWVPYILLTRSWQEAAQSLPVERVVGQNGGPGILRLLPVILQQRSQRKLGFKLRFQDKLGFKLRFQDKLGFKQRFQDKLGFKLRFQGYFHAAGGAAAGSGLQGFSFIQLDF
jgi:hypothetical protein